MRLCSVSLILVCLFAPGCRSPYRADQGALTGGALGAGAGALIGSATGNAGAGALLGAGLGAITGGVVGGELDQIDAENRARLSAAMGRPVAAGAVDITEVVSMTQANVPDNLIANHVRIHGLNRQLSSQDLIYLQSQGVSPNVVQAMQAPPMRQAEYAAAPTPPTTAIVHHVPPPPAVVVVDDPWCHPHVDSHHHFHGGPRVGWGFSYSNFH